MVLDTALLNTQHYKVRIKGKVELRSQLHHGVIVIEKGAFGSPSTKVTNFTCLEKIVLIFVLREITYINLIWLKRKISTLYIYVYI